MSQFYLICHQRKSVLPEQPVSPRIVVVVRRFWVWDVDIAQFDSNANGCC